MASATPPPERHYGYYTPSAANFLQLLDEIERHIRRQRVPSSPEAAAVEGVVPEFLLRQPHLEPRWTALEPHWRLLVGQTGPSLLQPAPAVIGAPAVTPDMTQQAAVNPLSTPADSFTGLEDIVFRSNEQAYSNEVPAMVVQQGGHSTSSRQGGDILEQLLQEPAWGISNPAPTSMQHSGPSLHSKASHRSDRSASPTDHGASYRESDTRFSRRYRRGDNMDGNPPSHGQQGSHVSAQHVPHAQGQLNQLQAALNQQDLRVSGLQSELRTAQQQHKELTEEFTKVSNAMEKVVRGFHVLLPDIHKQLPTLDFDSLPADFLDLLEDGFGPAYIHTGVRDDRST